MFIFVCYLLTLFVWFNLQKITKKENSINSICCLFTYFGTNGIISMFTFLFTFMQVLNFAFWLYMLCLNIYDDHMTRFYYFMISRKGVSRKFWLDPRFSRNPKLKWALKRLPLDRGCFKVYFLQKRETFLIISCHTYLSTFEFVYLF